MADEKTQADLDALAATIKPGPVEYIVSAQAVPAKVSKTVAPVSNSQVTAAVDPFEVEEKAFKLAQLKKQAEHEDRIRALEIEEKELSVLERKANLVDAKERQFERDMKRENKSMDSRTKGQALEQIRQADRQIQKRCNHKKGGNGLAGIIGGKGDAGQYAVLKHTMSNGDMWVRCLRCGKTWKPPLERSFKNPSDFIKAESDYKIAVDFQTLNSPSSSSQFSFSDQGQYFREQVEHVTLR